MQIGYTTDYELLLAYKARLVDQIPFFTNVNTWIDDAPLPADDPKDVMYGCSLSLTDSTFQMLGNNPCHTAESVGVVVTPMRRLPDEANPRLDMSIAGDERPFSLLRAKQLILSAILKKSPETFEGWKPTDADGNLVLLDHIAVVTATAPRRAEDWPLLFLSITFQNEFQWRL